MFVCLPCLALLAKETKDYEGGKGLESKIAALVTKQRQYDRELVKVRLLRAALKKEHDEYCSIECVHCNQTNRTARYAHMICDACWGGSHSCTLVDGTTQTDEVEEVARDIGKLLQ